MRALMRNQQFFYVAFPVLLTLTVPHMLSTTSTCLPALRMIFFDIGLVDFSALNEKAHQQTCTEVDYVKP
jgi:hypothetical protein